MNPGMSHRIEISITDRTQCRVVETQFDSKRTGPPMYCPAFRPTAQPCRA